MTSREAKKWGLGAGLLLALVLLHIQTAGAIFVSSPTKPILPGDITTSEILDGTIISADISATTDIGISSSTIQTLLAGTLTASSTTLLATRAGNVGIGTTSPAALLAVQGRIMTSGDLLVGSTTATGTITAATLSTNGALNVAGNINLTGTCAACAGTVLNVSYTAGNLLGVNEPVFEATTTQSRGVATTTELADDSALHWRRATFNNYQGEKAKQAIVGTSSPFVFNTIDVRLAKGGTPNGTVTIYASRDNGSDASSTGNIASTSFAGSTLTTTCTDYEYTFDKPVSVDLGETIHLVFDATDPLSDTNYYIGCIKTTNPYTGTTKVWHTGAWQADGGRDFLIGLRMRTTAGQVYSASANSSSTAMTYVGTTAAAAASGASVNVSVTGLITGLPATTTGTQFFLSNVPGTTTPSTASTSIKVFKTVNSTRAVLSAP